jgi:hypothetical protein
MHQDTGVVIHPSFGRAVFGFSVLLLLAWVLSHLSPFFLCGAVFLSLFLLRNLLFPLFWHIPLSL